jgi:hypothetical protein
MYWNHRAVKYKTKNILGDPDVGYSIHEVFYNDDGTIQGMTQDAVSPFGDTLEELEEEIKRFLLALQEPVLDYTEPENDD